MKASEERFQRFVEAQQQAIDSRKNAEYAISFAHAVCLHSLHRCRYIYLYEWTLYLLEGYCVPTLLHNISLCLLFSFYIRHFNFFHCGIGAHNSVRWCVRSPQDPSRPSNSNRQRELIFTIAPSVITIPLSLFLVNLLVSFHLASHIFPSFSVARGNTKVQDAAKADFWKDQVGRGAGVKGIGPGIWMHGCADSEFFNPPIECSELYSGTL